MTHTDMHRARVDLAHAAGMTLADAILDGRGNLLLPADTALTETALAALQRRGIEQCMVWADDGDDGDDSDDSDDSGAGDAAALAASARALRRLAYLFRHANSERAPMELLRLLTAYRNGVPP